MVAETPDALVVAFLGTKRAADHLVNLSLRYAPVFGGAPADGAAPAAHSGYLRRASGVPAEQLYQLARVQGKRLVLAGHSLGAAVATLATVRLLDALPPALHPTVQCIGFAAPPVGDAQLAAEAAARGWDSRISNYQLPEDWVPGLLLFGSGGGQSAAADDRRSPSPGDAHERVCWATHERVCRGHAGSWQQQQRAGAAAPAAAAAA